ncbi:MAG: hypothetical protein WD066_04470 [Planctomycetaceae bacterium]
MTRTRIRFGLALALTASLALFASTSSADEPAKDETPKSKPAANEPAKEERAENTPTLESLLERVPVLSSENEELQSYAFTVRIATFRVQAQWERGKKSALLITDVATGTPIALMRDDRAILFDAAKARLLLVEGSRPYFMFAGVENGFSLRFGIDTVKDADPIIKLDAASFIRHAGPEPKLERQPDGTWRFTCDSESGKARLTAIFDTNRRYSLRSFEIADVENESGAAITLESVSIDSKSKDELPRFPAEAAFPDGLPIARFDLAESDDATDGLKLITDCGLAIWRTIWGIAALEHPEAREIPLLEDVDWDQLARTHRLYGAALAKMLDLSVNPDGGKPRPPKPPSAPMVAAQATSARDKDNDTRGDRTVAKSWNTGDRKTTTGPIEGLPAEDAAILESLLEKVPVFAIENVDLRSFAFRVRMATFCTKVAWEREGEAGLLVTDAASGVPIVFARGRHFMLFDAESPAMILAEGVHPSFELKGTTDDTESYSYFSVGIATTDKSTLNLDLPSLIRRVDAEAKLERLDEHIWRFTGVTNAKKDQLTALFDTSDECTITSLTIDPLNGSPPLVVDRLTSNLPAADMLPRFPSSEDLPRGLPVQRHSAPRTADDLLVMYCRLGEPLLKSVFAIGGIEYPAARKDGPLPEDTDWGAIEAATIEYGPRLIEMLGLPGAGAFSREAPEFALDDRTVTVPLLSPANDDLASYDFTILIDGVRIRGAWEREGDARALLMTVAASETPIAYFRGGSLLLFDALDSSVVIANDGPASFELRAVGEAVEWRIGRDENKSSGRPFVVDLPSIVRLLGRRPAIEAKADAEWTATSVRGLRRLEATFDSAAPCPLRTLTVRNERTSEPVVVLEELSINEPVAKSLPRFPAASELPAGLAVRRIEKFDSADERHDLFQRMSASIRALHHVENPETRRPRFLVPVDWDKIDQTHRDLGPRLAKLFAMPHE